MVEKLSTAFGKASADSKIISRPGPSAGSPHWSPECLEKKRLKRQAEKAVHDIIFPKGTKEDPAHRLPLKDNQTLKEAKQCLKHATFNLKKALTDAKDASWQDYVKLIHYKLHPSSVWKHINQLQASDNNKHTPISLSPHPFNLKSLPSPYTTGGELLYTDKDKANSLAAYYSSISSESSARNKSTQIQHTAPPCHTPPLPTLSPHPLHPPSSKTRKPRKFGNGGPQEGQRGDVSEYVN
jgi:hypothetical protein